MRNICITGASRGIGLGFTRTFLAHGDRVFAGARNPSTETLTTLQSDYPDTLTPVEIDVADRQSVEQAAAAISGHTDRLDVLINNAGIAKTPNEQRMEDISEADVSEVFNVNTLGPLRVTQALFPLLRNGDNAKVVNISSSAGSIAGQGGGRGVPYCVSKAGLNMLTRLLYFHCKAEGIATVALHPGWVATDMGGAGSLSVDESVAHMMKVIEDLTTDSPVYVDYKGDEMPW